jgi:predicted dehydrogenase
VTRRLQVAMIGVGDITPLHRRAYLGFDEAELVALCDIDAKQLAARAEDWEVARTTANAHELLADPAIDLIEVNTPHHLHEKLVVAALDAGKHVACQKPLATSIAAAEAMLQAEARSRGRLRVLENFVFYPPYVKAKELVDGGEIGELLSIRLKLGTSLCGSRAVPLRAELWRMLETEKGMGQAIFDDGFHKLSMAMHLGGEVLAVKAFVDYSFTYIDAPAQLIWRYRDRPTLGSFDVAFSPNLYTSSKYFPVDERIDLVGSKGIINLTCCTGRLFDAPPLILYRDGRRYLFDELATDWQESFTAAIRDFPRAIREGRQALLSGGRALDIMKFAYAAIVSGRTGREVHLAEITDELVQGELA